MEREGHHKNAFPTWRGCRVVQPTTCLRVQLFCEASRAFQQSRNDTLQSGGQHSVLNLNPNRRSAFPVLQLPPFICLVCLGLLLGFVRLRSVEVKSSLFVVTESSHMLFCPFVPCWQWRFPFVFSRSCSERVDAGAETAFGESTKSLLADLAVGISESRSACVVALPTDASASVRPRLGAPLRKIFFFSYLLPRDKPGSEQRSGVTNRQV